MTSSQPIVSSYGNCFVLWDSAKLIEVLTQLKHERLQHEIDVESEISEGRHNVLMTQAEQMKQVATRDSAKEWYNMMCRQESSAKLFTDRRSSDARQSFAQCIVKHRMQ